MNSMIYSPPLIPFSTTDNIQILINRSNFTLIFLKAACHANPGAVRERTGRVHILPDIYSKISQIHQLVLL